MGINTNRIPKLHKKMVYKYRNQENEASIFQLKYFSYNENISNSS